MDNNDQKPAVASIKKSLRVYPYTPGGGQYTGSKPVGRAHIFK
jgi:hypothetical protein